MRKVRVWKTKLSGTWYVQVVTPLPNGLFNIETQVKCPTHAEAMFLAQLLADPHEYIRAAQERAWHGGKSVGCLQEYFKIPGPTSPYQKEDQ